VNGTSYSYDNNGNLTSDSTWTHTWDYNNRLTQSGGATATTTYAYDHTGQRIKYSDGTTKTYYPNKYFNVNNTTTTDHIFANDVLVATIEKTGQATTTNYIHTDHLAGTGAITDESGEVVQILDYYPFGEIMKKYF